MAEIEVKILDIDVDILREKLVDLGAVLVKKENQINYMYDYPNNSLTKNFKGFCRIRETISLIDGSKKYILGIKKMISQEKYKEMLEEETEVLDIEAAKRFLIELGLCDRAVHRKLRESYELNGALYEIDEWSKDIYPKPYLEIEAPDEETLIKGIEAIGYKLEQTTSKNLRELRRDIGLEAYE